MTDIIRSTKNVTRWKRLGRAFLRAAPAVRNWLWWTGTGGMLGGEAALIFCSGTYSVRQSLVTGAICGAGFAQLVFWLEKEKLLLRFVRDVIRFAFFFLIAGTIFLVVAPFWKRHTANRTATVRAVFLHPADATTGPQVYMNDGTVWALSDAPENVRMIQGDKVRYVFLQLPQGFTPDYPVCELKDVTTGYVADAERLSAPFKHSSCPAQ